VTRFPELTGRVAARRPGGRPGVKPAFRVLVHHKYLAVWNELADRVGLANAQKFCDLVAMTPGQPPKVGNSSIMKGKHNGPKWPGYSKMIHYEITSAGRIDYQFNPSATEGVRGDPHGVVKIWSIDLGSH
jgi:hypothetical protein